MAVSILLQNATILVPSSENDEVTPLRNHSLLIEGNKIAQIAPHITPISDTQVIDCTGKLVSPGFIDTHHHLWQTQLKGRHANHTLLEYMPTGNLQQVNYTPDDIFWGQLGGCLEALDAGTTTVVDHAHMNVSPAHSTNGLNATLSSGIRSIFCYAPTGTVATWKPDLTLSQDILADWVWKQLDNLAAAAPWGDGRIQLGLAFDGFFLPKEVVVALYERARKAGIKLITTHYVNNYFGPGSLVDLLDSYNLLASDILFSHATNLTASDVDKLTNANASISSTPDTELQMGHGHPVCFNPGCPPISSLGIDCHSNNSGDIVTQMRLALQSERARRNERIIAEGQNFRSLDVSVQDVFRLGTIQGARAIGMAEQIGSIEVGKRADLVVFDALSPGMVCAVEEDPIAAIVLHSSVRDIEMVMVDGVVRKEGGRLAAVDVEPCFEGVEVERRKIVWRDVARELLNSRGRIEKRIVEAGANDFEKQVEGVMKQFHVDPSRFV